MHWFYWLDNGKCVANVIWTVSAVCLVLQPDWLSPVVVAIAVECSTPADFSNSSSVLTSPLVLSSVSSTLAISHTFVLNCLYVTTFSFILLLLSVSSTIIVIHTVPARMTTVLETVSIIPYCDSFIFPTTPSIPNIINNSNWKMTSYLTTDLRQYCVISSSFSKMLLFLTQGHYANHYIHHANHPSLLQYYHSPISHSSSK